MPTRAGDISTSGAGSAGVGGLPGQRLGLPEKRMRDGSWQDAFHGVHIRHRLRSSSILGQFSQQARGSGLLLQLPLRDEEEFKCQGSVD